MARKRRNGSEYIISVVEAGERERESEREREKEKEKERVCVRAGIHTKRRRMTTEESVQSE
jgi:hypothetical protein